MAGRAWVANMKGRASAPMALDQVPAIFAFLVLLDAVKGSHGLRLVESMLAEDSHYQDLLPQLLYQH